MLYADADVCCRLFVKQGSEMAVASNFGELHMLHKVQTYADVC